MIATSSTTRPTIKHDPGEKKIEQSQLPNKHQGASDIYLRIQLLLVDEMAGESDEIRVDQAGFAVTLHRDGFRRAMSAVVLKDQMPRRYYRLFREKHNKPMLCRIRVGVCGVWCDMLMWCWGSI